MRTLLLVLVLALAGAPAYGQDQAKIQQARKLFNEGQTLYRLSAFAKALERFQAALKLTDRPSIVLNIAQCLRQLKRADKALFYYKLYLTQWERANPGKRSPYADDVAKHVKALEAELALRAKGSLRIVSSPPGAEVWLDGRPVSGQTPLTLPDLAPGQHHFEIRKGDLRHRGEVKVEGGQQAKVEVVLVRVRGALEVTSTPPGAEILLDARPAGTTPRTIEDLLLGQHSVELRLRGHVPARQLIKLEGPGKRSVAVTLRKMGVIAVRSEPPGAAVQLDGRSMGPAPIKLDVEPGRHGIKLRLALREEVAREVEVGEGATVELVERLPYERLVRDLIAKRRSKHIWGWSTLALAVASGVTGGILLGIGMPMKEEAQDRYDDASVQWRLDEAYDDQVSGQRMAVAGGVVAIVGVAALIASIIQFATAPDHPEDASPPAAAAATWGAGGVF